MNFIFKEKAHLPLPAHDTASFSICLPPWPPSRPAFSIEYDCAQPVIKFPTSDHNSSILNQMNLILNYPFTRTIQIAHGTFKLYLPLNKSVLTSFLSGTASAAAFNKSMGSKINSQSK